MVCTCQSHISKCSLNNQIIIDNLRAKHTAPSFAFNKLVQMNGPMTEISINTKERIKTDSIKKGVMQQLHLLKEDSKVFQINWMPFCGLDYMLKEF